MSYEAWGDGDDGYDTDHLIDAGWLTPDEAQEKDAQIQELTARVEDLLQTCNKYLQEARDARQELRRVTFEWKLYREQLHRALDALQAKPPVLTMSAGGGEQAAVASGGGDSMAGAGSTTPSTDEGSR